MTSVILKTALGVAAAYALLNSCATAQVQILVPNGDGTKMVVVKTPEMDSDAFQQSITSQIEATIKFLKTEIIADAELQKSLQISDDQLGTLVRKFEEFKDEFQAQTETIRNRLNSLRSNPEKTPEQSAQIETLTAEFDHCYHEFMAKFENEFDKIVFPFQKELIQRLACFQCIKSHTRDKERHEWPLLLANSLGFDDDEIDRIRDATEAASKEFKEATAKARQKALDQVMASMKPSRQDVIEEFFGEANTYRKRPSVTDPIKR